jgi:hypothetical protein
MLNYKYMYVSHILLSGHFLILHKKKAEHFTGSFTMKTFRILYYEGIISLQLQDPVQSLRRIMTDTYIKTVTQRT